MTSEMYACCPTEVTFVRAQVSNSELSRHNSHFLSTGTPRAAFNEAIMALMSRFGWRRAAVLYDPSTAGGYFNQVREYGP